MKNVQKRKLRVKKKWKVWKVKIVREKSVLELFFEMEQNLDKILPCISSNKTLF
jgi:hypothetical protein